MGKTFKQAELN